MATHGHDGTPAPRLDPSGLDTLFMATTAYLAFETGDEAAARTVAAELERNGWTPLLAGPELRAGENLPRLVETVGQAGVVVLFASASVQESKWLPREVAAALNNGRPIIVVRTGELPADTWDFATLDTTQSIDLSGGPEPEALARIT